MNSPLKILSLILTIIIIIVVLFYIFHIYLFCGVGMVLLVIISFYWYRRLGEDLVVYYIHKNSGSIKYNTIVDEFIKKNPKIVDRLTKKGIVEIRDKSIYLVDKKFVSAFVKK